MVRNKTLKEALLDFIPESAVKPISEWFDKHHVVLRITRSRHSKLGDFRGGLNGMPSYISVNNNLNKYSFFITLLHEMAHAEVHYAYMRRVAPHGKAWKLAYRKLALPFLSLEYFPEDVLHEYGSYLVNPMSSSMSYTPLVEALRKYNPDTNEFVVSMLAIDSLFETNGGKVFRVLGKLRKRYRCYCLDNKKIYLFNPMAIIKPVEIRKTGTDD